MLEGEGVRSMTALFLQMWCILRQPEFEQFLSEMCIRDRDEKRRKATLQASYNVRMLLQAVWIIVSIGAPCFQPFASVLPLLFPRVTIYYLQITGKYKPLAPAGPSVDVSVEDLSLIHISAVPAQSTTRLCAPTKSRCTGLSRASRSPCRP